MDNWKTLLADVDDDYLAGMANKGIVKRAYKDKEEGNFQIISWGEEAKVRVGEENVALRIPLGKSECTCPSRSVCRHLVQGLLVLKEREPKAAGAGGFPSRAAGEGAGGNCCLSLFFY